MLRMQAIAFRFPLGQHGADVKARAAPVGLHLVNLRVSHIRHFARAAVRDVLSGRSAQCASCGLPGNSLVPIHGSELSSPQSTHEKENPGQM
jgi:hypothetical protein